MDEKFEGKCYWRGYFNYRNKVIAITNECHLVNLSKMYYFDSTYIICVGVIMTYSFTYKHTIFIKSITQGLKGFKNMNKLWKLHWKT